MTLYISSLGEVEMGRRIEHFVDNFDQLPVVRYEFWSVTMTHSAYPMDLEEVVSEYGDSKLEDFGNNVWYRDMIRVYLTSIECLLNRIRGKRESPIVTLEDSELFDLTLSAEWLESGELRKGVDNLLSELHKSLRWFNIQYVAVQLATHHWLASKHCSLCKGVDEFDLRQQCSLVEDFAYTRGRSSLNGCSNAALALANMEGASLAKLFVFTEKQLMGLVYLMRGADIDPKNYDLDFDQKDETVDSPGAVPKEPVLTEGGIWVAK